MIFMNNNRQSASHTVTTDEEWSTRHLHEQSWIENYWKSRDHPHRHFLIEKISKYSPQTVLEIGCASGPNLYLAAKKLPKAEIRGIDINPLAVQKGNEWLAQEGISNVEIEVGRAQELNHFADRKFDVVFTDAVLIYIGPNEINHVVEEMLRIGKVVVLNEWHIFNKMFAYLLSQYHYMRSRNALFKSRSASRGFYVGHWARDYKTLFEKFVPEERICVTKLPKEVWNDKGWRRWGAIIEVIRQ
jgi:ubiquinone/menaquinone biosynthesis C-methylase UbiE